MFKSGIALQTNLMPNKYGNIRTAVGGRIYDSRLESTVARDIEILRKSGQVIACQPQKTYPLYGKNGARICNHRVDFALTFKDKREEVWEAKGIKTALWKLKVKLFKDNYPAIKYLVIRGNDSYYA